MNENTQAQIIDLFEMQNENVKIGLKRDFSKINQIEKPYMQIYRQIRILIIYSELMNSNILIFENIKNPTNFIEEALFSHLSQ